jgi:threonine dehydrogenase-like Zn-dependent dehydrogenase
VKAVRLDGGRALSVVEIPAPVAGPDEVLVRVAACGICGSDLSCYKTGVFAGSVLGHEISGTVEGSGARVVVDPKLPCGTCVQCASNASHRCVSALTRGIGQARQGGFAELIAVPRWAVHPVPEGVDLVAASLAEPLAVVLHGIGDVLAGTCLVLGFGPMGLLAVASVRADAIVGVDPIPERRALATSLGATAVFEPGAAELHDLAPDLVLECSGHPSAIVDAGNLAAPGARIVLLGISMGEAPVWPMVWVTKELTVAGSIAQTAQDFTAALDLLARAPEIGRIITRHIPLDGVPAAFEALVTSPDAGKVAARP